MARAGPEKPVQPRKMQNESIKYEKKKKSEGYIIKCLLTKLGRVGWENVWLSVMTKLRLIRHDIDPNLLSIGSPTQTISR